MPARLQVKSRPDLKFQFIDVQAGDQVISLAGPPSQPNFHFSAVLIAISSWSPIVYLTRSLRSTF